MAVENNLPVGLHINLTEGKPVSPPELIRSLLKNNEFRGKFLFKEALKNEEIDTNEILIEIYAQINKFQELVGIKPSHVDGKLLFFIFFESNISIFNRTQSHSCNTYNI